MPDSSSAAFRLGASRSPFTAFLHTKLLPYIPAFVTGSSCAAPRLGASRPPFTAFLYTELLPYIPVFVTGSSSAAPRLGILRSPFTAFLHTKFCPTSQFLLQAAQVQLLGWASCDRPSPPSMKRSDPLQRCVCV